LGSSEIGAWTQCSTTQGVDREQDPNSGVSEAKTEDSGGCSRCKAANFGGWQAPWTGSLQKSSLTMLMAWNVILGRSDLCGGEGQIQ